jgi:hypothetical protein
MHVQFGTAMVVGALIASIVLLFERGDRLFPVIAAVAAGIEALIVFKIIALSSGKFRIDIILPALLTFAGAVSWSRLSTKSTVTAATVVTLIGLMQLLLAIRFFN